MDAQMKKGILDMCILFMLSQERSYGYDIMKRMEKYFPDVNESTFYAILRRLHKDGLIEVNYGEESNGPRRKYYTILDMGHRSLKERVSNWKLLCQITEEIGIMNQN